MPGTVAASRTFYRIDISRLIRQRNRKIARITLDGFHIAVGNNFDIQVPADLDQFR